MRLCTMITEVLAGLFKGHGIKLRGHGDQLHATVTRAGAHCEHTYILLLGQFG